MDKHCRGCIRYLKSCTGMTKAVCEEHQLRIPRTNADRLRAMSDEELAEFLKGCGVSCPDGHFAGDYECHDCKDCWLDWLRQGASDG